MVYLISKYFVIKKDLNNTVFKTKGILAKTSSCFYLFFIFYFKNLLEVEGFVKYELINNY